LDEIGDLGLRSQIKLLRLIQEEEYYAIGSDEVEYANVRIIAATNADLAAKQQEGDFRRDLFYRLATHQIKVPPLRERLDDDLPCLLEHFVAKAAHTLKKQKPRIPAVLYGLLETYHFPGNIRELETLVFNIVNICKSNTLPVKEFRKYVENHSAGRKIPAEKKEPIISIRTSTGEFPKLKAIKSYLIRQALKKTGGNQSAAARLLGVSQSSLSLVIKKEKTEP
jgi:transcriptional regulator with PAS, ATPase and Fis domain